MNTSQTNKFAHVHMNKRVKLEQLQEQYKKPAIKRATLPQGNFTNISTLLIAAFLGVTPDLVFNVTKSVSRLDTIIVILQDGKQETINTYEIQDFQEKTNQTAEA